VGGWSAGPQADVVHAARRAPGTWLPPGREQGGGLWVSAGWGLWVRAPCLRESVSQPWLLVLWREGEPWFWFLGYSVMPGAEQREEGSDVNILMLFAGCGGLHRALGT